MSSFASALTFVLREQGTATTSHLNNPVCVGAGRLVGMVEGFVPARLDRDTFEVLDVWETFSDTDWLSTLWVQADGSPIPAPEDGSFGWAMDTARAEPGSEFHCLAYKAPIVHFFDGENFRMRLPNGMVVRPAFPAREMRGEWERVK